VRAAACAGACVLNEAEVVGLEWDSAADASRGRCGLTCARRSRRRCASPPGCRRRPRPGLPGPRARLLRPGPLRQGLPLGRGPAPHRLRQDLALLTPSPQDGGARGARQAPGRRRGHPQRGRLHPQGCSTAPRPGPQPRTPGCPTTSSQAAGGPVGEQTA
jgi:hypothetical protein